MRLVSMISLLLLCVIVVPVRGDVLDPESKPVPILRDLVAPLKAIGVDILYSHESEIGRAGPSFGDPPRLAPLLGFQGWSGAALNLDGYSTWMEAFESGARGAIAAAPTDAPDKRPSLGDFERIWNDADTDERVVITFDDDDREAAEKIASELETKGYAVYLAMAVPEQEPLDPDLLGRLFVEAGHVLVIETASARLNGIIQFEADLLAELRRQREWVASGDDGLPPIKRGSMDVVEALGVLPMKVLPGGIVLGTTPTLDKGLKGAVYAHNGSDYGLELGDEFLVAEQVSAETREAIEAFVAIADSHSAVDIAGDAVTLAAPFQGTRVGERIAQADRAPFNHLSIDGAQKSLIVDDGIHVRRVGDGVEVDVALQVRFYRRSDEGRARRIATVRCTLQDATGSARLLDLQWSRDPARHVGFNGSGTGKLAGKLKRCASDAALIGLARLTPPDEAP